MSTQTAQLNYLRIAPRKVRAVADLVRGLSANEAEAQLLVMRRRAARPLLKLLRSAVADAKHNAHLDPARLMVESIRVDQGPMLKRHLPRARGMATPIQKKMSHVALVLREAEGAIPSRFILAVPKKVKLPPESREKARKEKHEKEEKRPRAEAKKPGIFKKMFSRKAMGE